MEGLFVVVARCEITVFKISKIKLFFAKVTRDAVDLVTAVMVSFIAICFQSKDDWIYIEVLLQFIQMHFANLRNTF